MYALGIDLGTTFTAAAVWRDGRAEISSLGSRASAIPTIVVLREDSTIMTGEAASRRASSIPHRVAREFKRRLGDTTPILLGGVPYSAESLMAKVLRAVIDEVTAREGGPPSAVCVSHPANWGPYKTDLLQQAVRGANVDDAIFCTEPVAAAVSYAHQQRLPEGAVVAVYDLGGGTFDAAVLRKSSDGFEILGRPEGIERLGGIDFDAAVYGHVARVLDGALDRLDDEDPATITAVARLKEECVQAKEALSSDTETTIPILLPNLVTEVRLTRAEFETMVRPALQDTIDALRRALRAAHVVPDLLHSVLLVGGSSRIPIVAQLVGAELGRPVAVDIHPKHAVALGASWLASGRSGEQSGAGRPESAPSPAAGVPPLEAGPAVGIPASGQAVVGQAVVGQAVVGQAVGGQGAGSAPGRTQEPATQPTILLPAVSQPPDSGGGPGLPYSTGTALTPELFRQPQPGRLPAPTGDSGRSGGSGGRGARRAAVIGVLTLVAVVAVGGAAYLGLKNHDDSSAHSNQTKPTTAAVAAGVGESAGAPGPLVVVAHRGGDEKFPLDSLPALVSAAQSGAAAQFDVLWTSDDVPILLHETTTVQPSKANTETPMVCTGGPYVIAKTKWDVLRTHCSSLASASADGQRYPLATFDQAMKALTAVSGSRVYPEVTAQNATKGQTAAMLATIDKYGMVRRSVVGAFYPAMLKQVRGQAIADHLNLPLQLYIRPGQGGSVPSAADLSADHLSSVTVREDGVNAAYVASLKAQNLMVMSWVLNTQADWLAAKKAGVTTVFTDKPAAYQAWAG